jgi:ABC-type antimicrobial peptide transport system permease subunit
MTEIVNLGQAISLIIAGLCVFASVGYTVMLRLNEYQTLRVLGYGDRLITALVMVEIAFIGLAASVLAIPIGAAAAVYYNREVSLAWFQIDTIIGVGDYARAVIPSLLLLLAVAIPAARIVLRTPVEAGLRAREIE